MCLFFSVSRAAYYAWVKQMDQPDPDEERLEMVREAYQKSRRTYGYRRICLWIGKNKQIVINHKAVLRLTLAPGASAGEGEGIADPPFDYAANERQLRSAR